ncbi:unnamed protein product [Pleuronectes platessa]|uniref:Uncharacterized protein n=1 Tax=Pleuronectes platessa TaxID=8262 RepID=A0A9N7Y7P0_PLEPL|nr:unnamed protein product [Pleuronectes platessa]
MDGEDFKCLYKFPLAELQELRSDWRLQPLQGSTAPQGPGGGASVRRGGHRQPTPPGTLGLKGWTLSGGGDVSLMSYRRQRAESVAGQWCRSSGSVVQGSEVQQQTVGDAGVSGCSSSWSVVWQQRVSGAGVSGSSSRSVVEGSVVQQQQVSGRRVSGAAAAGHW